jgi:hypothetical protein
VTVIDDLDSAIRRIVREELAAATPAMPAPTSKWIPLGDIAPELQRWARAQAKAGVIGSRRVGRALCVDRADLDAAIAALTPPTPAPSAPRDASSGRFAAARIVEAAIASGRVRRGAR